MRVREPHRNAAIGQEGTAVVERHEFQLVEVAEDLPLPREEDLKQAGVQRRRRRRGFLTHIERRR